ncbi:hypothetical protein GCM10009633_15210 [Janibacter melonis]
MTGVRELGDLLLVRPQLLDPGARERPAHGRRDPLRHRCVLGRPGRQVLRMADPSGQPALQGTQTPVLPGRADVGGTGRGPPSPWTGAARLRSGLGAAAHGGLR